MARKRTVSRGKRVSAGVKATRKVKSLLPVSVRSHLKASIRECLLAFESLFDEAVKGLERKEKTRRGKRGRRIKVE